jgi:ribA/ribD-fused uncharacterized protein
MNKIYFWRTNDPYGCLSNFSKHPVIYAEQSFPTSEHLYQALKFYKDIGYELIEKIRLAETPKTAKVLTYKFMREWPDTVRPNWDNIKLDVMRQVLRLKYDQHEFIRNKLKESGEAELIESSPYDAFWGYGPDQKGQNWLGKLWMELRENTRWCRNCEKPHPENNCPLNNGGRN